MRQKYCSSNPAGFEVLILILQALQNPQHFIEEIFATLDQRLRIKEFPDRLPVKFAWHPNFNDRSHIITVEYLWFCSVSWRIVTRHLDKGCPSWHVTLVVKVDKSAKN